MNPPLAWRVILSGILVVAGLRVMAQQAPDASPSSLRLVPLLGSRGFVSATLSPNGALVATADDSGARIWDVATGHILRSLNPCDRTGKQPGYACHGAWTVAFSASGQTLFTGDTDGYVEEWDVSTGKQLRWAKVHGLEITVLALTGDGKKMLTASFDGTACLLDVATLEIVQQFSETPDSAPVEDTSGDPSKDYIHGGAISPDGRFAVLGDNSGLLAVFDAATGKQLYQIHSKSSRITAIAISPDGKYAAADGFESGGVGVWPLDGAGQIKIVLPAQTGKAAAITFDPTSRGVVTESADGRLACWNVDDGQLVASANLASNSKSGSILQYSRDGRSLIAFQGETGSLIQIPEWSAIKQASSWKRLQTFSAKMSHPQGIAVAPNNQYVAISFFDGTIRLWDLTASRQSAELTPPFAGDFASFHTAFSPDSTLLISDYGGIARIWDVQQQKIVRTLTSDQSPATAVAFDSDAHPLTAFRDGKVMIWDSNGPGILEQYEMGTSWAIAVARSHDGHLLAAASSGNPKHVSSDLGDALMDEFLFIRLWDTASRHEVAKLETQSAGYHELRFSPDDKYLGAAGTAASTYAVATGNVMTQGDFGTFGMDWSPDGRYVVYAALNGLVDVLNHSDKKQVLELRGHEGAVGRVAYTPDGKHIVTVGADTTVRIWSAETGAQEAQIMSYGDKDWVVADPSGRFDTSSLDEGAPLAWVISSDPLHALPIEIFMRDYYTPRLLASIMNGETLPDVRPISEIKNRVQPEVAIVSAKPSKTHPGRADVVVRATSRSDEEGQASGLADLRLFRNGQLVGIRAGALHDGDFTFSGIQLPTLANKVIFTAYAFNSERIKSATAAKGYAYTPGGVAKPRAFLLQIGVNHYHANGCELQGSATDARRLSKILSERLVARGFDVRAVTLVSTGQANDATKAKIRDSLAAIVSVATPDDVLFLSFSGHGYTDPESGQFYILPSDMQGTCTGVNNQMLKTAISADELAAWLQPMDAGQMTFILDSCDSAGSVESNGFKPGPMGSRGLGQLAYDKRMRILAASQPNQAARESDSLHQGLLSYALTEEGLIEGKADWQPVDGKIMVGEWLNYAANAVPKFLQSGAVETHRGLVPVGQPEHEVPSTQTPAVFDFSKQDTFVLQ